MRTGRAAPPPLRHLIRPAARTSNGASPSPMPAARQCVRFSLPAGWAPTTNWGRVHRGCPRGRTSYERHSRSWSPSATNHLHVHTRTHMHMPSSPSALDRGRLAPNHRYDWHARRRACRTKPKSVFQVAIVAATAKAQTWPAPKGNNTSDCRLCPCWTTGHCHDTAATRRLVPRSALQSRIK